MRKAKTYEEQKTCPQSVTDMSLGHLKQTGHRDLFPFFFSTGRSFIRYSINQRFARQRSKRTHHDGKLKLPDRHPMLTLRLIIVIVNRKLTKFASSFLFTGTGNFFFPSFLSYIPAPTASVSR